MIHICSDFTERNYHEMRTDSKYLSYSEAQTVRLL